MNKKLFTVENIPPLAVLLSFFFGLYFYSYLPDQMVSHWGISGEANGYLPKFPGTFIFPVILLAMYILFLIIPKIDPKKDNIQKFHHEFQKFMAVFFAFMFYLYFLVIIWNLGSQFSIVRWMIPGFVVLFYYMGDLTEKAKPNWSIGIRTPWTLSDDAVWKKTHEVGGKLFKWTALISLLGFFFPAYALWIILVPVVFSALYSVVYSYLVYKKK